VSRLVNAGRILIRPTPLMTLYGGMQRSELSYLREGNIDSQPMIIRVGRDRQSGD